VSVCPNAKPPPKKRKPGKPPPPSPAGSLILIDPSLPCPDLTLLSITHQPLVHWTHCHTQSIVTSLRHHAGSREFANRVIQSQHALHICFHGLLLSSLLLFVMEKAAPAHCQFLLNHLQLHYDSPRPDGLFLDTHHPSRPCCVGKDAMPLLQPWTKETTKSLGCSNENQ
jgi:hypothetical protein